MQVAVFVHETDRDKHPDQAGWRWAVHVGPQPDPADMRTCANAGSEPSRSNAVWMGDRCGATLARGLQLAGQPVQYVDPVVLDHDPTPLGGQLTTI